MDMILNGLGIEIGQTKKGLHLSADLARRYLSQAGCFNILDRGNITWTHHQNSGLTGAPFLARFFYAHNPLEKMSEKTHHLLHKNPSKLVLNWGGDHSLAIASLTAFKRQYPHGKILWIDAHGDINSPDASWSGQLHGMPLHLLLENQVPFAQNLLAADDIFYFGLRDLDTFEKVYIQDNSISYLTSDDINQRPWTAIKNQLIHWLKDAPLHISFDIDAIDPKYAPSTGVTATRGLTPDTVYTLAKWLRKHASLIPSIDIVEINPWIGTHQQIHQTYEIAIEFLKNLTQGDSYVKTSNTKSNLPGYHTPAASLAQYTSLSESLWPLF